MGELGRVPSDNLMEMKQNSLKKVNKFQLSSGMLMLQPLNLKWKAFDLVM